MNTNTDFTGVPHADAMAKLANEIFKAAPGRNPDLPFKQQGYGDPLLQQGQVNDLGNPQTSLYDPHVKALSESGASPSSVSPHDVNELKSFQTSSTVPPNPASGTRSVAAGSGISPSAINQGNAVDLRNPRTSFNDPHLHQPNTSSTSSVEHKDFNVPSLAFSIVNSFGLGYIPKSIGGSDISVSGFKPDILNNAGYASYLKQSTHPKNISRTPDISAIHDTGRYLPYASQQPFEGELQETLKYIHNPSAISQLPSTEPAYYFFRDNKKEAKQNAHGVTHAPLDVNLIKRDFPILQERVNGRPLIWLDNAATTQKPKQVIDRISYFYEHENSNIHRAAHELAARATDAYEGARQKVQVFLNANSINEIVFVRGTTEGINLVAKSWGEQNLHAGDEIIVSHLEHHANIVPWQQLAAKKNLKLKVIPVDDDGQIIIDEYAKLLNGRTKLVSITQVSNALGTITPVKQVIDMAHSTGAKVLVDGAQSVSHMRVDVQALNCDWFVFSGHKVFGPTGIGALYGKENLLNETQPWQGGGNMIMDVTFEYTKYHNSPSRFEAGTGNIADAVGLGAAIDYVTRIGIDLISQYEHYLLLYATKLLKDIPGLHLIGTAPDKASVLSFVFDGYRTEEVGTVLNQQGIAVRTGHHCAQPILRRFGLETTVRPSLAFYNTCSDIDTLADTLYKLRSGHARALKK